MDTLYYDGKCELCSKEIALLNRLKDQQLTLLNIHDLTGSQLNQLGVERSNLLTIMHLKKADKTWLQALDATVHAWQHTRLGWLFAITRWPVLKGLSDKLYMAWASKRACRLGYNKSCSNPNHN